MSPGSASELNGAVAALSSGLSIAAWVRPRVRAKAVQPAEPPPSGLPADDVGWLHRWRWAWASLAGAGGAAFVSGRFAVPAGVGVGVLTWVWIGRCEPVAVRRRRQAVARDLPALGQLLAAALESGCDVVEGLLRVCEALPGPASELLGGVPARLALGMTAEVAWRPLLVLPETAPLARALVRADRTGSSVTHEVTRLAEELEERARAEMEQRARAVGVRAALPLGLCLLPAFLLIGVVPLVVALLQSLRL